MTEIIYELTDDFRLVISISKSINTEHPKQRLKNLTRLIDPVTQVFGGNDE